MCNDNSFKKMYDDFGVSNEDELFDKLIQESETIPCYICGQERALELLKFIDGDPVCIYCLGNEN